MKTASKQQKTITFFRKKRQIGYFLVFIVAFFLPFVRINGNHFFLLNFDKAKLNLFFASFNTNELYLMPFCLILMFAFIFFITSLLGRVWCAWACPQTIFRTIYRDLLQTKIFKIYAGVKNRQSAPRNRPVAKVLALLCFALLALVAASNFMWYFVPPEDFFAYLARPAEHKLLIAIVCSIAAFLVFDITFIKENFCAYICPYARIQSVMFDDDTRMVIYDEGRGGLIYKNGEKITKKPIGGECIGCEACVKVCPTHIDIRRGLQLDCINCLECADACSSVQARFNRPSLINWTSTNANLRREKVRYLRPKTIGYVAFLCVIFTALLIASGEKSSMLLNINRTSELYKIQKDGEKTLINNSYTMLFHNTSNQAHEIFFKIDDPGIKIIRPTKSFKLQAGAKSKKIVQLQSECANSPKNTDTKEFRIRAYAIDDEGVFVEKQSIFIYPKEELCKSEN